MTNPSTDALRVCTECGGTGTLLIELYHRQGFDRDTGYIQKRVKSQTSNRQKKTFVIAKLAQ